MHKEKLKISIKDWLFILFVAAFFGFFNSLIFYFISVDLQDINTIIFSVSTAIIICFFSFVFITFSNEYVLPRISEKLWYLVSFIFSFLGGFLGFLSTYEIYSKSDFAIVNLIKDNYFLLSIILGFLTLLIGLILHKFISMKYENELIQTKILKSKLKALENELNPHFLFNALNSISELIYIDKMKAEQATLNLAGFLRNAIKVSSLVSIEEEIKMVENYLEIESIRFDGNIILNKSIKSKNLKRQIPKFSIQLLVENAIKHGYENKTLNIDIIVCKNYIEVSNDGKSSSSINYGTGLKNLEDRLKLLKVGFLEYKLNNKNTSFFIKFVKEIK